MTRRQTCCWTCCTWWPPAPTTWRGTWSPGSSCTDHQAPTCSGKSFRRPHPASNQLGHSGERAEPEKPHLVIPKSDTFTSLFFETRQFLAAWRMNAGRVRVQTQQQRRTTERALDASGWIIERLSPFPLGRSFQESPQPIVCLRLTQPSV